MKSKLTTHTSGEKWWYNEKGQSHRLNGPAYVNNHGFKTWRIEDICHRLNGPAFVGFGDIRWHINLCISYDPIMDNA